MVVFFKILTAIIFFFFTFFFKRKNLFITKWKLGNTENNQPFEFILRNRKHKSTFYRLHLKNNFHFKINKETMIDNLFKSLFGFKAELQTGDIAFDREVYFSCDHKGFIKKIGESSEIKQLLTELVNESAYLVGDGECLVAYCPDSAVKSEFAEKFIKLKEGLSFLDYGDINKENETNFKKVLFIEASIYAFVGYLIPSYIHAFLNPSVQNYLDSNSMMLSGALIGLAVTIILTLIISLLLRKSSRGHRVISENFVVLVMLLPISFASSIYDINKKLDYSIPCLVKAQIVKRFTRNHGSRTRHGHAYVSYHFDIKSVLPSTCLYTVPSVLEVDKKTFRSLEGRNSLEIKIYRGFLEHPWIESVR